MGVQMALLLFIASVLVTATVSVDGEICFSNRERMSADCNCSTAPPILPPILPPPFPWNTPPPNTGHTTTPDAGSPTPAGTSTPRAPSDTPTMPTVTMITLPRTTFPRTTIPSSPDAHAVCDSTSITLIMDRSLLDIFAEATDVHFSDETCVGYDYDMTRVAITTRYDQCGTTQKQEEKHIVFSNIVTYYEPSSDGDTITREHILHIPVTCYLEREQLLGESFKPRVGEVSFKEVGFGNFTLSLERFEDIDFNHQANDTALVDLGEPLYFGINLTTATDLTLLIESCWATPSGYPLDPHSYVMIDQGCAKDHTVGFHGLGPTFKGFHVDAFSFIGDYDQVYVHCSVLVCDGDPGSRCSQGCVSRTRRSLHPTGSRSKPHTISNGPLSAARIQHDGDGTTIHSVDSKTIAAIGSVGIFIALLVIIGLMVVRMRSRPESQGYRRVNVEVPDNK